MRWNPAETRLSSAMELALRPQGVSSLDFPGINTREASKAFRTLLKRGHITIVSSRRPVTYRATQEQYTAYLASLTGHNYSRPTTKEKVLEKKQNVTYSQPKPRPVVKQKAKPTDPKDMHWPVDADGKPLWKHTICPGFTGNPIKTNTHTGAY